MSDTTQPPKPLTGRDLVLYRCGISLLVVAGAVLGLLLFVYLGVFHGDFLTFDGALEAAGGTLGAIATTLAAIGSALLFVVSLRVQARELQHSIQELKNSVEAQRSAAISHKQALELAQQELLIAKQEKEFNVLLSAYEDVKAHLESIRDDRYSGLDALGRITQQWLNRFSRHAFEQDHAFRKHFRSGGCLVHEVLPHHLNIQALVTKAYWIFHSVCPREPGGPSTKELDPRDRALIFMLITPIIGDISRAIGLNVVYLIARLKEIEGYDIERLQALRVNTGSILICRKILEDIDNAKSRRDYDVLDEQVVS